MASVSTVVVGHAELVVAAAARPHVGEQDRLGVQGDLLGHLDRHHHQAVVVAADDVARADLRAADADRRCISTASIRPGMMVRPRCGQTGVLCIVISPVSRQ